MCLQTVAKSQMRRHLRRCPGEGDGMLLQVTNAGSPKNYWLYLSAAPDATLADLDTLLRAVWLECCGHLSSLEVGGRGGLRYESQGSDDFGWDDDDPPLGFDELVATALPSGTTAVYEYDFGTTSALDILRHAQPVRAPSGAPVQLLARNLAPEVGCDVCRAAAAWADWERALCEACWRRLDDDEREMLMPLCNSPRAGLCGYDGSDDPYDGGVQLVGAAPS
jgi:hypothetical protein